MKRKSSPTDWKKAFKARIQLLREGAQFSQGDMAKELGVPKDTYAKWENREGSVMRHDLIPRFLELTGGSYEYLFEGRSLHAAQKGGNSSHAA